MCGDEDTDANDIALTIFGGRERLEAKLGLS